MTDAQFQQEKAQSKSLLLEYARSEKSQASFDAILKAYASAKNKFVYDIDFYCEPDLYAAMKDVETTVNAQKALGNWSKAPICNQTPALLSMTAMLCLTSIRAEEDFTHTAQLTPIAMRHMKIWEDVFGGVPGFKEAASKELAHAQKRFEAAREKYPQQFQNPSFKYRRVFEVSAKCVAQSLLNFEQDGEDLDMINPKLLAPVNKFCSKHLSATEFAISTDGRSWLIAQSSNDPSSKNQAKQMAGQLSDGWGGNMSGICILDGVCKVYVGWDVKTIKLVDEQNLETKPKSGPR